MSIRTGIYQFDLLCPSTYQTINLSVYLSLAIHLCDLQLPTAFVYQNTSSIVYLKHFFKQDSRDRMLPVLNLK